MLQNLLLYYFQVGFLLLFWVFCLLFVDVGFFFKNTVVCVGHVDFSEIFFENSEELFQYYCLAVIQLAVFFLISCYSNFMLFFILNVSPVYSFLVCKLVISILQSGGSGLQKTSCHSAMPHAGLLERLFAGRFVGGGSLPGWLQVSSLHPRQQDPLFRS